MDLGDLLRRNPTDIINFFTSNGGYLLIVLRENIPELYDAVASRNESAIKKFAMKYFLQNHKQQFEFKQELARIEADPFNPENQKKISEQIKLKNVQANFELAMEELPEVTKFRLSVASLMNLMFSLLS